MPYDVLHGKHHAQCHFPFYHQCRYQCGNDYILRLIYEYSSRILILGEGKTFDIQTEKFCLYTFPLPAFLLLTGTESYFLHTGNQLYHATLIGRLLSKTLVVQFRPFLQEQPYIDNIDKTPYDENQEDSTAIKSQYNSKYQYIEHREKNVQAATCQKALNTGMVIDALKNIPSHFSIEIPHGQFHQFAQKVGDEGNVDSCSQVQQNPATDKVYGRAAESQHQLCQ